MDEDKQSISQLNIIEGKSINISVNNNSNKPRYYMVGNGIRNTFMGNQHKPIDAIEVMSTMTTSELWTLNTIKKGLQLVEVDTDKGIKLKTSCHSIVIASTLTDGEKQKFKAGYKLLRQKDLVRRLCRENYYINPNFLVPYFYDKELITYNNCK